MTVPLTPAPENPQTPVIVAPTLAELIAGNPVATDRHHWHPSSAKADDPECCLCAGDGCVVVTDAAHREHAEEDAAVACLLDQSEGVDVYDGWPY